MLFKSLAAVTTQVLAVLAAGNVLSVEKVFHTIVNQSPFLVERTTTVTWTQSASLISSEPTSPPTPTINY
ncbi:hypothetical protein NLJ89_g2202 [Agrocybe chaxingu]|uniref:Uncharacterized protein n=1 Tax=Agrocybe chaxingu TaxID=84603 RepID=A0A9W8K721_9AGAR|nr:hypothetical protein NLJ89_g2202 [Agrocybe chaxingu]